MATTTNFGWETPDDTDLVKDGAAAMRTLGNSIDASFVDLKGGTTGQVLSKNSNTDLDFTWVTSDDANAIQNAIVDAKGDLIAASAADTPARLAVGNNGETLVADSSQTTGLRYNPLNVMANPVINGGMDIWQRGTSFAGASSSTYTADRWNMYFGTSPSNWTLSRQSVSDSTNLPNIQYCIRVQRNAGATTAGGTIGTSIEIVNAIPFAGKSVTLSFYARKGANYSGNASEIAYSLKSGTGTTDANGIYNTYTGQAFVVNGYSALTTTWQRFAYSGNVASTATQLAIAFDINSSGTAGAADYVEITGVQIDVGTYTASSAPTFRRSGGTLAGELAACQRYYFRASADTAYAPMNATGYLNATTNALMYVTLPVTMRVAPTSVDYSTLRIGDVADQYTAVSVVALDSVVNQKSMPAINCTTTGATQYRWCRLQANNSTSAYIGFSAEL